MRRRLPTSPLLLAAAALLAGCGAGGPERPGSESGQYAGIRDGFGALVDFTAADPTTAIIRGALAGRRPTIAVASIVNRTDRLIPIPAFTAYRVGAQTRVLLRADRDPAIRAAGVREAGAYVPANGAITVYLLMDGSPRDVVRVGMRAGLGEEVRLNPQRGDGAQPRVGGG